MAEQSKIEWTDATWNPITGCTLVDEGCRNCYAADLASTRLKNHPSRKGLARKNGQGVAKFTGEVRFNEYWLYQPLKWKTTRMIFVCAHGDLFHENVPNEWIDQVFAVMALCPRHKFQVLTKRPDRAAKYLHDIHADRSSAGLSLTRLESAAYAIAEAQDWDGDIAATRCFEACCDGFPNIWLGTSVSDQDSANERIPHLLQAPAAIRFISAEPLLGPVNLNCIPTMRWRSAERLNSLTGELSGLFGEGAGTTQSIDWVIVGGESGRNARPMHPQWARDLRDQCQSTGTKFFFKQWGNWTSAKGYPGHMKVSHVFDDGYQMIRIGKKFAGNVLDGETWTEVPA